MNIKVILCVYCFLSLSYNCLSQTFVPDDNFEQALIDLGYDSGPLDDIVPTANINNITDLDISSKNIADLTGIEDFSSLQSLNCQSNLLTSLDISSNTSLTQLFCSDNNLTIIDISMLLDLQIFWCLNNKLTNINVANNTKLISLVCGNNLLNSLDVNNNISLNVLSFDGNQISTIDVSNNSTLSFLSCSNNLLTNLDITKNTNLSTLDCNSNQLTVLDLSKNNKLIELYTQFNALTALDLSQNPILTDINCSYNNLCALNAKNGNNVNFSVFNFKNNPNLNCVVVDNPSSNHTTWSPSSFSNYVTSQSDCSAFVPIDTLNDVITNSFTLPTLTYGNYYTATGGNGTLLNAGDVITTSQTIYIYNETVCDSNETSFNVFITNDDYYIPKYFTPNNDGTHDVWMVNDFKNTIKSIEIFDRYGKFLKYLQPSTSWNGTFNGNLMESNDYWYVITFKTGETLRGHFTLKR